MALEVPACSSEGVQVVAASTKYDQAGRQQLHPQRGQRPYRAWRHHRMASWSAPCRQVAGTIQSVQVVDPGGACSAFRLQVRLLAVGPLALARVRPQEREFAPPLVRLDALERYVILLIVVVLTRGD